MGEKGRGGGGGGGGMVGRGWRDVCKQVTTLLSGSGVECDGDCVEVEYVRELVRGGWCLSEAEVGAVLRDIFGTSLPRKSQMDKVGNYSLVCTCTNILFPYILVKILAKNLLKYLLKT